MRYVVSIAVVLCILMGGHISGMPPSLAQEDSDNESGIHSAVTSQFRPFSLSMPTPYTNRADMLAVHVSYSEHDSAPWGFEHRGIDFCPSKLLAPFQAVFSGVVEVLDLYYSPTTMKWHVNLKLVRDNVWSAWYAFEPMTGSKIHGKEQMRLMAVSQGDHVKQGDLLGYLYDPDPTAGAHVHFTLNLNDQPVCPEPYFTYKARKSVLDVIHDYHPDWRMCYLNYYNRP